LKAGVSFQERISCDDDVTSEVQTLEQMMDEKFPPDVSEEVEAEVEGHGGKNEPPASFLSSLKGMNTVRKYLMKFDAHDNKMAALSSI
jgi:hypothetical protein